MTDALKGRGSVPVLSGLPLFRNLRLIYDSPATNVDGRVEVSVIHMMAVHALKLDLALAVFLRTVAAFRAGARGVSRVNERDGHARQSSLVGNELSELEERPTRNSGTLLAPEPFLDAAADARQILKGNPAPSACGGGNKFLADDVVSVRAKANLLPALTPEKPANRTRTLARLRLLGGLALERLSERVMLLAHLFDFRAGEYFSVGGRGDVRYPEVNADEVGGRGLSPVGQGYSDEQEPSPVFSQHKVTLPFRICEPLRLISAHDEGDNHAPREGQEAHTVNALKAKDTRVVRHGGVFAKLRQLVLVAAVGRTDVPDADRCHLRRQLKLVAERVVMKLLQFHFIVPAR